MATLRQITSAASPANKQLAFPNPVAAGSMLLLVARFSALGLGVAPSDDVNGAWPTPVVSQRENGADSHTSVVAYLLNSKAGTPTVTCNPSGLGGSSWRFIIAEYSGIHRAVALDGVSSTTNTDSSSDSSGSITTLNPQDLLIGACADDNNVAGTTWTTTAGWTLRQSGVTPNDCIAMYDKTVSVVGAQSFSPVVAGGTKLKVDSHIVAFVTDQMGDIPDIATAQALGYVVNRRNQNQGFSGSAFITELSKLLSPIGQGPTMFNAAGMSTASSAAADTAALASLNAKRRHRYTGSPVGSTIAPTLHGDFPVVDVN